MDGRSNPIQCDKALRVARCSRRKCASWSIESTNGTSTPSGLLLQRDATKIRMNSRVDILFLELDHVDGFDPLKIQNDHPTMAIRLPQLTYDEFKYSLQLIHKATLIGFKAGAAMIVTLQQLLRFEAEAETPFPITGPSRSMYRATKGVLTQILKLKMLLMTLSSTVGVSAGNETVVGMEHTIHRDLREKLKKKFIFSNGVTNSDKLNLIDAIQRLGIGYQFENEIKDVIQYLDLISCRDYVDSDLHTCSLRFRLLREHGYKISEDIFKKFINHKGEFNTTITSDIKGMLSLYEATHFRLRGEDLLEKALIFTTSQFEAMLHNDLITKSCLVEQVKHALNQSFHKGLIRIEARKYISLYENDEMHDKTLLKFAKLDFNILQKLHQRELGELTRWWKDLDLTNKFPFARDRLVECYLWSIGIYFEPQYAYGRTIITMVITLLSVMDDIYDAYGTWEELVLFTNTMNSWERNEFDGLSNYLYQLPEYMKYFYQILDDFYKWLEKESVHRGILHGVKHIKHSIKVLANGYMDEATWLHKSYIPTLEEYMNVAKITSAVKVMSIAFLLGMHSNLATKEGFEWMLSDPLIIQATSVIVRLVDDVAGFKFEQQREHVASAVECYMNQHDVLEELATINLRKQITDAWKDINFECIRPTKVPMNILSRVMNMARYMDMMYKEEDGYTNSKTKAKDYITSILVSEVDV
ncbi:sesquiterpene synthase 2-like [Impatiens glandulifera]|uniref:sesquiterpene synthase 2-like n=1 Tax=Impatiens glandulifera TaxID=253017 RepID=UPI001FB16EE2|nr:sesquiterpene synthase 2-like [Impatiens glandulifera]